MQVNGNTVFNPDALGALRAENARLIALLESHGIDWRLPQPIPIAAPRLEPSQFSTAEKIALFRRLFRGRTDVYPVRWEGKTSGKSGYAPACANEWRAGVCEKPRIKCGDCNNRLLIPLSDAVIYDRLAGTHLGDDSAFTTVRQDAQVKALQEILQLGDEQLAQGKVKPVTEVVKRLRRVK